VDSEHGGMSSHHEGMLPVDSVDVGQRTDASWTVLSDPEGNEFCVLSSRDI